MESFLYIEPSEEDIDAIAKQIASKIRKISPGLRGPMKGICIGNHLEGKESRLSGFIDELIMVEAPAGSEHNTEAIAKVLAAVVAQQGPGILFLGFTHQGMELAPAVGWCLGVPVVTSCVDFQWTDGQADIKRAILGGKLLVSCSIAMEQGAVISVQKGAWKDEVISEGSGDPVLVTRLPWQQSWAAEKTEIKGISEETGEGEEDITKAEILVSAGRGIGDPDNLPIIKELADKLGGMISCSRPVVDLGWLPASRQVGISGKTVAPVIYLALGISGQTNHLAGMDASGTIIAVNKDPLAPIFNVAQYGIVDDILGFIPELIEQIRKDNVS